MDTPTQKHLTHRVRFVVDERTDNVPTNSESTPSTLPTECSVSFFFERATPADVLRTFMERRARADDTLSRRGAVRSTDNSGHSQHTTLMFLSLTGLERIAKGWSAVATVAKTKEPKKRYGAEEGDESSRQFWKEPSRASGSSSDLEPVLYVP